MDLLYGLFCKAPPKMLLHWTWSWTAVDFLPALQGLISCNIANLLLLVISTIGIFRVPQATLAQKQEQLASRRNPRMVCFPSTLPSIFPLLGPRFDEDKSSRADEDLDSCLIESSSVLSFNGGAGKSHKWQSSNLSLKFCWHHEAFYWIPRWADFIVQVALLLLCSLLLLIRGCVGVTALYETKAYVWENDHFFYPLNTLCELIVFSILSWPCLLAR